MNTTTIDNAIKMLDEGVKALKALKSIAEIVNNPELCAEAMVAEIGEVIGRFVD